MIHFIVKNKNILLSLMLVETFANNSIYFPVILKNEDLDIILMYFKWYGFYEIIVFRFRIYFTEFSPLLVS